MDRELSSTTHLSHLSQSLSCHLGRALRYVHQGLVAKTWSLSKFRNPFDQFTQRQDAGKC